jgi:CRISPR-associated endonuclease Cas1
VIDWLAAQNIPLVRINWQGEVITVIGSGPSGSVDSGRAAEQEKARRNGQELAIAAYLVRQKLENSAETLRVCLPDSPLREKSIATLEDSANGLIENPPAAIGSLLGIEGSSAVAYFNAWQVVLIKWVGTRRHPIPREWLTVGTRSSERNLDPGKNGRATHPVNAILNYAYAILEAQVRIQIVAEGYDQSISYLHVSRPNRPGLVLDFMEPLRPIVDREVLRFLQANTFKPGDFTLRSDGVCRLNPEMARRVVGLVMEGLRSRS